MVVARIVLTFGLIVLLLVLALVAAPHAWPASAHHGDGHRAALHRAALYRAALQHRAALAREAELEAQRKEEAQRLAAEVAKFSRRYGSRTGRWYPLVDKYFPASQIDNALYCIKHESGGDPWAHNGIYHGLFQLGGYSCNVWPPETNIRLAAKLWRARGWQPWSVMH